MSALSVNDGFMRNNSFRAAANPAESGAQTLADLLAERGVTVGGVGSGVAPAGTVEIASIDSAPLPAIVGEELRVSDNGTSELMLKEIGYEASGTGATAAGAAAVTSHLHDEGLPIDGFTMIDGSGLDRGNRVTCNLLTAVLDRAGPHSDLTNDLSIAGRDRHARSTPGEHCRRGQSASEDRDVDRCRGPRRLRRGDRRHRDHLRRAAER